MKLSLVISTLTCGGAERVMSLLANEWVRRGHQVQLVTLDRETPFFPLDSQVGLVQLDCERPSPSPLHSLWNLGRSVAALRSALKTFGPDGIVSFTTKVNVKTLMAAQSLNVPVVVSERTDPASFTQPRFWRNLTAKWYPKAHRLVVQTPRVLDYYRAAGLERLVVIPNPVESVTIDRPSAKHAELVWLTVARLSHEKGIDLLLRAWAHSAQGKVNRLRILGDGNQRSALEELARTLGISDRVEFLGFVADKARHWQESDAFVLSSRFEGFPNALCEALAAGLPCVSFDCPSGPSAIIRDGINGLLVPAEDVIKMAEALDKLAADAGLRDGLAREGVRIVDTLGLSGITDRWDEALRR